jgi:DNA polymerase III epsilon subunit-like protein
MNPHDRLEPVPDDPVELVALDLEGSGAQDREDEAILEIAVVPIVDWEPHTATSYCTLVNPGRSIPRRPWISPGLTDAVLTHAPSITEVEPRLAAMINGRYVVGHNVNVDWRLLHRRCPTIEPAGLIDTLRLARAANVDGSRSLGALVERLELTALVNELAVGSQPHRAHWDTVAAAMVLKVLSARVLSKRTLPELVAVAGASPSPIESSAQPSLFE